jgi:hypothetical protein
LISDDVNVQYPLLLQGFGSHRSTNPSLNPSSGEVVTDASPGGLVVVLSELAASGARKRISNCRVTMQASAQISHSFAMVSKPLQANMQTNSASAGSISEFDDKVA